MTVVNTRYKNNKQQAIPATKKLESRPGLYQTETFKCLIPLPFCTTEYRSNPRGDTMDIPILIQKRGGSRYGVTVPDIPGCVSSGETVDRAMSNATRAIYGHVGQWLEQGKAFELKASEVEYLSRQPSYANGIWAMVSLDLARLDDPPVSA